MTIKRLLIKITLLNLCTLFLLPVAYPQDFKILATDEYGIVLEFKLPAFEVNPIRGADGHDYQRLEVAQWAKTDMVGAPELPFTATLLQVPATGDISIQVEQQDQDSAPLAQLYPVPQPLVTDNGDMVQQFTQDAATYTTTTFYPNELISLDKRAILRDDPVVRVKVYPFQWNPSTQTLRYTTYLRLRLHFAQPLPSPVPSDLARQSSTYERLLRSTINGYQPRQRQAAPVSRQLRQGNTNFDGPHSYNINLKVKQAGMYRVTYEELLGTGLPETCLSQGQFVLYNQGQQIVPQIYARNHRWFSPGDSLQFYAQNIDNLYTDTNIYRLTCWLITRPRPTTTATATATDQKSTKLGNNTIDGTVTSTATPITHYQDTLHLEQNLVPWENTPGAPQQDYWFWEKLTAPGQQDFTLTIPSLDTTARDADTFVTVGLRGFSTATPSPNHHTLITLNNVKIGDYQWDADKENVQKLTYYLGLLKEGDNTLRIDSPGDTGAKIDVIYTNWVEITYPRQLHAVQDELKFTLTGKGRQVIQVSQLSTQDVTLYDLSDPSHVKEVINYSIQPDKNNSTGYQLTFEDKINGQKTYYLLATAQLRQVDSLTLLPSSHLKQPTNGADYILITAADFLPAVQPLLERRTQQGLRVTAINIEDIYNEFGDGFPTPQAIKDFLTYAYQHWQAPAPSYVLLWGDATLDYKGYLSSKKKFNIIPAYLVPTVYSLAPSDNWYVSVQGQDSLPDMMIGRLPSNNLKQVTSLVDKIINYETDTNVPATPKMLIVADNDPSFEAASDETIKRIPASITVNKVYLGTYPSDQLATADIIDYLDKGMAITQYVGHGNETLWANSKGQRLFEISDISTLKETGKLTFLIVLNCLNANFADATKYSLSEQFILAANKGTFANFAPSSVGYLWEHQLIDSGLLTQLFEKNSRLVGEIATQAKLKAYSLGVSEHTLSTFLLIGDPASQLQLP